MKKFIALMLAAVMIFALTSCAGSTEDETTTGTDKTEETKNSETTSSAGDTTGETTAPEETEPEKPEKTLPEIIDALYEAHPVSANFRTSELDLSDAETTKYQIGLESVDKVAEGYVSGPMMTSVAYELALLRVKDAADAEDIAREILEGANPGKWICVHAESVKVAVYGDLVLLVMSSEEDTSGLVEAFGTVCGELDLTLEK